MNLMAFAFWTDGGQENSPMPKKSGLRKCETGAYVRLRDTIDLAKEEQSDLPSLSKIPGHLLHNCLENAEDEALRIHSRPLLQF